MTLSARPDSSRSAAGSATSSANSQDFVLVNGHGLKIDDVAAVANKTARVHLSEDPEILARIHASCAYVNNAVDKGLSIYGVTTGFGGMVDVAIPREEVAELQNNLTWFLKAGTGNRLPIADVRAGMLLRANSLMRGYSAIRLELIRRIEIFLNAGMTPLLYDLGSIGASGDLVPLSTVTGALIGLDESFKVDDNGEEIDAVQALQRLGLPRIRLQCKEGLALMNGTSIMTGIAANCVSEARLLLALTLETQGLYLQGLKAKIQSFDAFIHDQKPHPGQIWSAAQMRALVGDSKLVTHYTGLKKRRRGAPPVQDRYSIRCMAQYLGPIVDGLTHLAGQIEIEMNCTNDNPLINPDEDRSYHCGNFLGQYVGVAMDRLRFHLGMAAKHMDVQIASLVAPEFNNGLPASLVGNTDREVNMGFKGLQISGNSIMPLISYYGMPLVDRYPTHAEQFNQNINSLGFGSANLARQSIDLFRRYMGIALMFGVQAVDLRTKEMRGHFDARKTLSERSLPLYTAVREVVGHKPSLKKPYIWNDDEQPFDEHINKIVADIKSWGKIPQAVQETLGAVKALADEPQATGY